MPSLQHQLLARVIPRLRAAGPVVDPAAERRAKLTEHARTDPRPPARLLRGFDVSELDDLGFPAYDIRVAGSQPARAILYLHGGAYVSSADRVHWKYAATLALRLDARVVLPLYPLAPEHTWRDSHDRLLRLFTDLAIESPAGVALMGDSAGGGYALALAQQLAERPGPQPTHLVLISPWVDLTGSVPGTDEASARDPWLNLDRLRLFGQWWAGEDDPMRPELSPLFGDLSRLPQGLMLCGTRDTLQPQCRRLAERAREQGWDLTYVEEPGLLHVYPILPIPEAKRALEPTLGFLAQAPAASR